MYWSKNYLFKRRADFGSFCHNRYLVWQIYLQGAYGISICPIAQVALLRRIAKGDVAMPAVPGLFQQGVAQFPVTIEVHFIQAGGLKDTPNGVIPQTGIEVEIVAIWFAMGS